MRETHGIEPMLKSECVNRSLTNRESETRELLNTLILYCVQSYLHISMDVMLNIPEASQSDRVPEWSYKTMTWNNIERYEKDRLEVLDST